MSANFLNCFKTLHSIRCEASVLYCTVLYCTALIRWVLTCRLLLVSLIYIFIFSYALFFASFNMPFHLLFPKLFDTFDVQQGGCWHVVCYLLVWFIQEGDLSGPKKASVWFSNCCLTLCQHLSVFLKQWVKTFQKTRFLKPDKVFTTVFNECGLFRGHGF